MKANEFVKKHGWVDAIKYVKNCHREDKNSFYDDLKRLVESHELIEKLGGLKFAKDFIKFTGSTMNNTLENAIADVESCIDAT